MTQPLCRVARETGGLVPLDCLFGCPHGCAEADEAGPRVIIAGSRGITSYHYVDHAMGVAFDYLRWPAFVRVVSGAARGVDRLGERWAREHGVAVKGFPVSPLEWQAAPRTAGHARNRRMAEYASHLVAIWDGTSGGTAHMVRAMRELGKPVLVANLRSGQYEAL